MVNYLTFDDLENISKLVYDKVKHDKPNGFEVRTYTDFATLVVAFIYNNEMERLIDYETKIIDDDGEYKTLEVLTAEVNDFYESQI